MLCIYIYNKYVKPFYRFVYYGLVPWCRTRSRHSRRMYLNMNSNQNLNPTYENRARQTALIQHIYIYSYYIEKFWFLEVEKYRFACSADMWILRPSTIYVYRWVLCCIYITFRSFWVYAHLNILKWKWNLFLVHYMTKQIIDLPIYIQCRKSIELYVWFTNIFYLSPLILRNSAGRPV